MYVLLMDKSILYKLKDKFISFITESNNPYIYFKAIIGNIVIECFNSGKIVIKGNDIDELKSFVEKIDLDYEITSSPFKENIETFSSIGSDEVGTGDLFGPVVICSFYLDNKDSEYLLSLGITDSKKLTDDKIRKIGALLKDYTYNVILINNKKYNELINDGYNMNEIKAIAHNKGIICTLNDINKKVPVILDEFASSDKYYSYLRNVKLVYDEIIFHTKAESKYLAVACASVMARYIFLLEMDKISKKIGFTIPKGAGADSDKALEKLKEMNYDLSTIAKLNFKNITK